MKLKNKNEKIKMILIIVLVISIILNLVWGISTSRYKSRVGKITYDSVIKIKVANISNNELLTKSIESKSIDEVDVLKLYKNYIIISDNIIGLWDEYNYYQSSEFILFKKKINTDVTVVNEIHSRIEEYLNELLKNQINNNNNKVILNEKDLDNFIEMQKLSKQIIDFYAKFIDDNMSGLDSDERKDEVIKKYYWIDILDNIDSIGKDHSDFNV